MISIGYVNLDDSVGRGTHWVFFFFKQFYLQDDYLHYIQY